MIIGVPLESCSNERRVALVSPLVPTLAKAIIAAMELSYMLEVAEAIIQ